MAQILKTKNMPSGKVILHLELTREEAQRLKNHAKKIHLFSENLCLHEAKLMQRGANHSAKSVEIPLSLKSRSNPKITEISYQKIETDKKVFYIATAKKDPLSE